MADFKAPEYPEILTVKDWNSNKGIWAKIVGSTGIGQLMTETERYFKGVDWSTFDFVRLLRDTTASPEIEDLDRFYEKAGLQIKQTDRTEASAGRLKRLAIQVHKDFKANTVIPKSSSAHAKAVLDAATEFEDAMGAEAVKKLLDAQYVVGKEYVIKERAEIAKSLKTMIAALGALESKAKGIKTAQEYSKMYDKELKAVRDEFTTAFKIFPAIQEVHKGWRRATDKKPAGDDEVKDFVDRLLPIIATIRKAIAGAGKI
jgi:hypothetical protein